MNKILSGIKRLFYGKTTVFTVYTGSITLNGHSFVEIYRKHLEYPVKIMGIKFNTSSDAMAEWRIVTDVQGKVFPYNDTNIVDNNFNSIVPVEVSAGELLMIEVRSTDATKNSVVILEELDIIESR